MLAYKASKDKDIEKHYELSKKFIEWNDKWKAPFGGMFSLQQNSDTRRYEYPWAFYAIPINPGMKVLELGGGLSGFQFVLDKHGIQVDNVDPGKEAKGRGWPVDKVSIEALNEKFGTNVHLHNCFIQDARLESNYFDAAYSISVLEHLTDEETNIALEQIYRILKPGGYFVLTVDLFLNIYPFSDIKENQFGTNKKMNEMIDKSNLKLIHGKKAELYGYKEFNKERVIRNLHNFILGRSYPVLVQTIVLQKE